MPSSAPHLSRVLCSIALTISSAGAQSPPADGTIVDLWITGVHVVNARDGTIRRNHTIGVAQGKVVTVMPAAPRATMTAARRIDGNGRYAIPGMWDAHVHLFQHGQPAAEAGAAQLLAAGVTHARDMGSSLAARRTYLREWQDRQFPSPTIRSAGTPLWGEVMPYGDPQQRTLLTDTTHTDSVIRALQREGVDFLKVYAGFDRATLPPLLRAARRLGLQAAGHAQPGVTLAEHARLGMPFIEHLDFDTFRECDASADRFFERVIASRFRGATTPIPQIYAEFAAAVDTPACARALARAATAGIVITPTLSATYLPQRDADRVAANLPSYQRDECARYRDQFTGLTRAQAMTLPDAAARLLRMVRAAHVTVLAGTDAPTFCAPIGTSLATELAQLHRAGLSLREVLQSTTSAPAAAFGLADRLGTIAPGFDADLVLLDGNPLTDITAYARPRAVYTAKIWYDSSALAGLRAAR